MNPTLAAQVTTIFITALVGLIVWIIQNLVREVLDDRKEERSYKLELEKRRDELDKQLALFKYQTQFAALHVKEAQLYADLNEALWVARRDFTSLASPLQTGGQNTADQARVAQVSFNALSDLFHKNTIYLDDEVCSSVEEILTLLMTAHRNRLMGERHPGQEEKWENAWTSVTKDLPILQDKLRIKFREILYASGSELALAEPPSTGQNARDIATPS